jgi:hypothetical protein
MLKTILILLKLEEYLSIDIVNVYFMLYTIYFFYDFGALSEDIKCFLKIFLIE